jgi:hypothetical protein
MAVINNALIYFVYHRHYVNCRNCFYTFPALQVASQKPLIFSSSTSYLSFDQLLVEHYLLPCYLASLPSTWRTAGRLQPI